MIKNSLILENGQMAFFKDITAQRITLYNKNIRQIKEIKDSENNIIKLVFNEEKRIKLGDNISIELDNRKIKYIVNFIKKTVVKDVYTLHEFIDNYSKFFLTPIYGGNKFSWKYPTFMINTYLNISKNDKWTFDRNRNVLYLVYRFSPNDIFCKLENKIFENPDFLKKYDVIDNDDRFVIYIMNIPKKYRKDVSLFKKGKYKYLSEDLKKKIMHFHELHKDSHMANVLHDSDILRSKMEYDLGCDIPEQLSLYSKPNLKKEIWHTKIVN